MSAAIELYYWERYEAEDRSGKGGAVLAAGAYMASMRAAGWSSVAVDVAPGRIVVHSCISARALTCGGAR